MAKTSNFKKVVGVIVLIAILAISTMVSAYSVGMTLTSSSKLKEGENVVVNVNLGTIDAGNGIDTIAAKLVYDTNVFEVVNASSFASSTGWTMSYAESTNMLTGVKNSKVTSGEVVCTITLKVKDSISKDSTTITLNNITVSGGRVQDGGTGDIIVNDASVKISKAKEPVSEQSETPTNKRAETPATTTTTAAKKDTTVNSTSVLPKTGINNTVVIAILSIALVGIGSFVVYKKMSKEVK